MPYSPQEPGAAAANSNKPNARNIRALLPAVPLRQWVFTLPHPLRARLAYDAPLLGAVTRLFVDSRLGWYRRRLRLSACEGAAQRALKREELGPSRAALSSPRGQSRRRARWHASHLVSGSGELISTNVRCSDLPRGGRNRAAGPTKVAVQVQGQPAMEHLRRSGLYNALALTAESAGAFGGSSGRRSGQASSGCNFGVPLAGALARGFCAASGPFVVPKLMSGPLAQGPAPPDGAVSRQLATSAEMPARCWAFCGEFPRALRLAQARRLKT